MTPPVSKPPRFTVKQPRCRLPQSRLSELPSLPPFSHLRRLPHMNSTTAQLHYTRTPSSLKPCVPCNRISPPSPTRPSLSFSAKTCRLMIHSPHSTLWSCTPIIHCSWTTCGALMMSFQGTRTDTARSKCGCFHCCYHFFHVMLSVVRF